MVRGVTSQPKFAGKSLGVKRRTTEHPPLNDESRDFAFSIVGPDHELGSLRIYVNVGFLVGEPMFFEEALGTPGIVAPTRGVYADRKLHMLTESSGPLAGQ